MNENRLGLLLTALFALALFAALRVGLNVAVSGVVTLILLGLLSAGLSLHIRSNSRDRYYLITPAFFWLSSLLTISGLRHNPLALPMLVLFTLLSLGLVRSIQARHTEPRAQVPLHQNTFLSAVWISLYLAVLSLYNILSSPPALLLLTIVAVFAIVFVLIQSLLYYVRIPPWNHRALSAVGAFGIAQVLLVLCLWTINPFVVAGYCFILFYLFWGLTFHQLINRLTRKILYEYTLMSGVGLVFLLLISGFKPHL